MPPLKPETRWSATLVQTWTIVAALVCATWWVRGEVVTAKAQTQASNKEVSDRLASIEHFIRDEAVTQSQADRYANAFRWENRAAGIVVPSPSDYQDKKPKS